MSRVPALARVLLLIAALLLAGCGGAAPATGGTTPISQPAGSTATTALAAPPTDTAIPAAPPTDTAPPAPPTDTAVPPPPTDTAVPPTATAPPGGLEVLEFIDYENSIGSTYVIGLVKNTGGTKLENLKVVAEIRDASDATLGSGSDLLLTGWTLDPGETLPFRALIQGDVTEGKTVHVQSQWTPYNPSGFHFFAPVAGLSIEGDKLGKGIFGQAVQGRVKNSGSTAATLVNVLAIGYDADGKFVDVASSYAQPDPVLAGSTSTFKAEFERGKEAPVAKYTLMVRGVEKK